MGHVKFPVSPDHEQYGDNDIDQVHESEKVDVELKNDAHEMKEQPHEHGKRLNDQTETIRNGLEIDQTTDLFWTGKTQDKEKMDNMG